MAKCCGVNELVPEKKKKRRKLKSMNQCFWMEIKCRSHKGLVPQWESGWSSRKTGTKSGMARESPELLGEAPWEVPEFICITDMLSQQEPLAFPRPWDFLRAMKSTQFFEGTLGETFRSVYRSKTISTIRKSEMYLQYTVIQVVHPKNGQHCHLSPLSPFNLEYCQADFVCCFIQAFIDR